MNAVLTICAANMTVWLEIPFQVQVNSIKSFEFSADLSFDAYPIGNLGMLRNVATHSNHQLLAGPLVMSAVVADYIHFSPVFGLVKWSCRNFFAK